MRFGNPVRFVSREIEIKPDMQWRNSMAKHQKLLVTLITLPLLVKYGYLGNGQSGVKTV